MVSFQKPQRLIYDKSFLTKNNALSSIYSSYLPNDIKEVFKWVNFIIANVPKVQSALDKYSSVAITSINYLSEDLTELGSDDANSWKNILEEKLRIKPIIKEIAYNYTLYGNHFVSVNFPMNRVFICPSCKKESSRFMIENQKITPKIDPKNKNSFVINTVCPHCKQQVDMTFKDIPIKDLEKIKIIHWNVNSIELYEDNITGMKTFYYTPGGQEKDLIKKGNKDKIFNLPSDIITAALNNGKVKFNEDKIIHLPHKRLCGNDTGWGIPKLTSAIPDMISLLLLRKSNEKIYTDMMFPLRALVPRVNGVDQNSMYGFIDGSQMSRKIEATITRWKKDPTAIQFFPIPLEPVTVFGEGKQLNLSNEIEAYSDMILSALGIPREFISGGLAYNGSSVSLRILQNELLDLVNGLETIVNFIIDKISNFIHKKKIRIKLIPIKLIDDAQEKQLMLSLLQAGKVSGHTALNFFDIDYRQEQSRIEKEQKEDIRRQLEMQQYQQELSTSLEDKIKQESMMENSNIWNINQQAILQQADAMVQQISQLPYGEKKSKLDGLEKENPILYAVVKWRLEFQNQKASTEAKYQDQ